jgi:hypothetical protein
MWYKYLLEFDIPDNQLTGTVPKTLVQQSRLLQVIQLAYNHQLTGINLQDISPDIKRLGIDSIQSTSTSSIPNNTNNTNNSNTNIHRTISDIDIRHLQSISYFDMANNLVYGTVPSSLFTLPYIIDIDLSNNNLYGTIPTIMNVPGLARLLLEKNKLTGTIPTAIYQQTLIGILRLGHNHINGTISNMISNLQYLVDISLDHNLMTGTIPISIGTLKELSVVSIIGNKFNGTIPLGLCDSTTKNTIAADCQGASSISNGIPEIICPIDCCTTCCLPDGMNCIEM